MNPYSSRSSFVLNSSIAAILASTAIACAESAPESTSDAPHAESAVRTQAQAQSIAAAARLRPSGSITVMQQLVDYVDGPLLSVSAVITNGPTQIEKSCKTRVMGHCELVTCDKFVPGNDKGIGVGTIQLNSASGSLSVEPQFNDTYAFVYDFFGTKTLWSTPGELITTTYTLPGATPTTVRQAAPATNIIVTNSLPSVISKLEPVTLSFIGAQPQREGGKIYASLLAEDGLPTDNGVLSRAMLTCSASPDAGFVTFGRGALAQLPAGQYLAVVQAENILVDKNGITHSLVAPVDFPFVDVTVQ